MKIEIHTDGQINKNYGDAITIATHNGVFHADEVFACALLILASSKDIYVLRTRDIKIINNCDFAVDVGGEYNGETRFDHHQAVYNHASAGMVYKACIEGIIPFPQNLINEELSSLIAEVDAHDLGKKRSEVAKMVASLNLIGGSKGFKKALDLVIKLIQTGELYPLEEEAKKNLDLEKEIEKGILENIREAISKNTASLKKGILILESLEVKTSKGVFTSPLKNVFHYINGTQTGNLVHSVVVDQISKEGDFLQTNVQKVPQKEGDFSFIGDPYKAKGGELFVHPVGFFMACPSKETAIKSLEEQLPDLKELEEGSDKELCSFIREKIS